MKFEVKGKLSICKSGMDGKFLKSEKIIVEVSPTHPLINNWNIPDHTKIEEFRSRLSPETQCLLTNAIVKLAAKKGFANPAHIDIDSTVQIPDMQYPATINLLVKAAAVGRRVQKILMKFMPERIKQVPAIDMKVIKGIAKQHYFEKRKAIKQKVEARKQALAKLWGVVSEAIQPVIRFACILDEPFIIESLPLRDKNLIVNFIQKAPALLGELFERSSINTNVSHGKSRFCFDG